MYREGYRLREKEERVREKVKGLEREFRSSGRRRCNHFIKGCEKKREKSSRREREKKNSSRERERGESVYRGSNPSIKSGTEEKREKAR